jgi:hypothetical protein
MSSDSSAPWRNDPNKLVSWWDMEKFAAAEFYGIAVIIERQRSRLAHKRPGGPLIGAHIYELSADELDQLSADFEGVAEKCKNLGLPVSEKTANSIKDIANGGQGKPHNRWAVQAIDNFQQTLFFETQNTLFLKVDYRRKTFYEEPLKEWEEVTRRFPAAVSDIEEASRCYACDRYAGAVFHAMLIAERGAVEIGKLIEINDPKPGWPSTIREMDRIVHKAKYDSLTALEQKHRPLLERLLPSMQAMQTGWRHKISHVEGRLVLINGEFSQQTAEEILIAVRGFMRNLAGELPK